MPNDAGALRALCSAEGGGGASGHTRARLGSERGGHGAARGHTPPPPLYNNQQSLGV